MSVSLGLSLMGLAPVLLAGSALLAPLASARPRGTRQRQQRRARARVARATGALAVRLDLLPADRVVDVVAQRGRIVVRTHLMLSVPFAVMSIGFLLTSEGVLLRDFARSHGDVPLLTMSRVLVVMAAYLIFLAAAVGVQRSVWNRHPDLFAAVAGTLAALVEQRFGDLPRGAGRGRDRADPGSLGCRTCGG